VLQKRLTITEPTVDVVINIADKCNVSVDWLWIQMMFYHCENKRNPDNIYSQDICTMIKKVSELNSQLVNYDYPQDYYDSEKKRLIDSYEDFPVTKMDFSGISEEERLKIRNEIMRAEWEKSKKQ